MSTKPTKPLNFKILDVSTDRFKNLPVVTSLDIMDGATRSFSPDGLFSVPIFGRVGDPERDKRFAQIVLKTVIIHHIIYKALTRTKGLYADIINGVKYAKWNPKEKDFEACDMLEGETGYGFFVRHINEIDIKENDSPIRQMRAQLLRKYRGLLTLDRVLVLPAGLRDAEIQPDGSVVQAEVNNLYRNLLKVSNNIILATDPNSPLLDNARRSLQNTFNELGDYFIGYLSGKTGAIYSKFLRRRVQNSVRSVITGIIPDRSRLDGDRALGLNQHCAGFYNQLKGLGGLGVHYILKGPISNVFNTMSREAYLINKKTLKREIVNLRPENFSAWTSVEGIEKQINRVGVKELRFIPIEIEGYYLALVYRDDKVFKVFHDIGELPKEFSKDNVTPITLFELMYISTYRDINKYPATITRYPIAGDGSFYASKTYVRTSVRAANLAPLNDDWLVDAESPRALEYPLPNEGHYDSMSPNPGRLRGLGGDHDGDQLNQITLQQKESIDEIEYLSKQRETYISSSGKLRIELNLHPVKLLFNVMTGNRK